MEGPADFHHAFKVKFSKLNENELKKKNRLYDSDSKTNSYNPY